MCTVKKVGNAVKDYVVDTVVDVVKLSSIAVLVLSGNPMEAWAIFKEDPGILKSALTLLLLYPLVGPSIFSLGR